MEVTLRLSKGKFLMPSKATLLKIVLVLLLLLMLGALIWWSLTPLNPVIAFVAVIAFALFVAGVAVYLMGSSMGEASGRFVSARFRVRGSTGLLVFLMVSVFGSFLVTRVRDERRAELMLQLGEEVLRDVDVVSLVYFGSCVPTSMRSLDVLRHRLQQMGAPAQGYERALTLFVDGRFEAALKEISEHTEVSTTYFGNAKLLRAGCYTYLGRHAAAAREYRSALYDNPNDLDVMSSLGLAQLYARRFKEAEQIFDAVRRLLEAVMPDSTIGKSNSLRNHGWALEALARYEEAEALLRQALVMHETIRTPDSRSRLEIQHALVVVLWRRAKNDEAEVMGREALEQGLLTLGRSDVLILNIKMNLGIVLAAQGLFQEAEVLLSESVDGFTTLCGSNSLQRVNAAVNLATVLWYRGKIQAAMRQLTEISDSAARLAHANPEVAISWYSVKGLVHVANGENPEAVLAFGEAFRIADGTLPSNHAELGKVVVNYGCALRDNGELDKAEQLLMKGYELLASVRGDGHPDTTAAALELVRLYELMGDAESVQYWSERAREKE